MINGDYLEGRQDETEETPEQAEVSRQLKAMVENVEEREKVRVEIPVYDPKNQFTVEQLVKDFPDWNEHGDDPELVAVNYERTRALREISRKVVRLII